MAQHQTHRTRVNGKVSAAPVFGSAKAKRLAANLEAWFDQFQRDLPWRERTRTVQERAYRCLVAEFMLHQTQVSRVLDFYRPFIERYPTVQELASGDEQAILALWQGLGYYRRARLLHACAKQIVTEFNGRIPSTAEQLITLPGIGRYTAGALASIAFGQHAAIVDGNVARVQARLTDYESPVDRGPGIEYIWRRATEIVKRAVNPGNLNQGLMELGSTVCTPAKPACDRCPVSRMCAAKRHGTVALRPIPKQRPTVTDIHFTTIVVKRAGRTLLLKRPAKGLWAGLWQCPTLESTRPPTNGDVLSFLHESTGLVTTRLTSIAQFIHQTSHRRVHFDVYALARVKGRAGVGSWVRADDLPQYPISNAMRRILNEAGNGNR